MFKPIASAAVSLALIAGSASVALAQKTDEQCRAEFAQFNAADSRYEEVRSKVDTNQDGTISQDEYIVACKEGVMAQALPEHKQGAPGSVTN